MSEIMRHAQWMKVGPDLQQSGLGGQWRLGSARQHISGSLASAEPAAALDALTRILERERNQDVYAMSVT